MSDTVFRNPDKFQVLPLREYIRQEFPRGSDGLVAEDLDLVIRHFGSNYGTDAKGRLMLIEQKHAGYGIGTAQQKTFGLIDELLRRGDPDGQRYLGYYLLNCVFDGMQPVFPVTVNGQELDREQFHEWLEGALVVRGYFGPGGWGKR